MNSWSRAMAAVRKGVADGIFPGACAEVGSADGALRREAAGRLGYEADAPPVTPATVYDLASLTKPIATASVAMHLVETGALDLEARIASREEAWRGEERAAVTVRDLLEHAGGLPAWAPLWKGHAGKDDVVGAACRVPLEYSPRSRSLYSDVGFIVLGSVLERVGEAALDEQFDRRCKAWLRGAGEDALLRYLPPPDARRRTAPTQFNDARERLLVAEVDDDNAWAMGGVAGHAGLFGTVTAVGLFAQTMMRALRGDAEAERQLAGREVVRRFLLPSAVPGSSRALAWDLMRTTSSCGTRMSPSAFGHTGFTGTSLWIDPARDAYAALLSNRVHPIAGPNEPMQDVRRAFHDALMDTGG